MNSPRPDPRAFALVLVLIVLLLTTTMVVLFLAATGQERRSVDSYSRGNQVRHLARLAVHRVMGQVNAATKEGTATTPVSWASQPGMIRTYGGNGSLRDIYKLYSWDSEAVAADDHYDPFAATEVPPTGWENLPAQFTDLNQPVSGVYPIVDPDASGANATTSVEGFSIDPNAPAVQGSQSKAPMPVKWLYVLEDGQMVAPTGGTGNKTVNVSGANPDNPVVARIAFWTDDETCKVNVNTASEGAFWDWPKAATYNEMQFAGNPPVGGEFNRIPGHPAMTSLSAVFPELAPGDRWESSGALRSDFRSKLKALLSLTPRVAYDDNSSRGGTYPVEKANFNYGPSSASGNDLVNSSIPSKSIPLKADRLLVSPDELYFSTTFNVTRTPFADLTPDMIRKRLFFLTASSRAPETTLFETPRISLWPVTWPYQTAHAKLPNRQTAPVSSPDPNQSKLSDNKWMRAEERLLAFTSILNRSRADGGDRYFFQRQNCESPTYDYEEITRNQQLLSYLQRETNRNIPGFGGNFAAKFTSAGRDAILANTFNSVRSLVNQYTLQDDGKMLYSYTPVSFAQFTTPSGTVNTSGISESNAFCPTPMKLDLGSGEVSTIGEFPTLREAALVFYATDRVLPQKKPDSTLNFNDPMSWDNLISFTGVGGYPVGARTTKMRAVMILDFFNLRGASRNNQPVFWVKLSSSSMSANGNSLGFDGATAKLDYRANSRVPSYMLPFFKRDSSGKVIEAKEFNNGDVNDTNYGLISAEVSLDPTTLEFDFSGGQMTLELYAVKDGDPSINPTGDPNLKIGTYTLDFSSWNGKQKVPIAPRWVFMDKLNSLKDPPTISGPKGVDTNWKGSMCPNPGFRRDPKKPADAQWVSIEIAPAYRSATSSDDGTNSIPAFSGTFTANSTKEGSIEYSANPGNVTYHIPPTYAFCDENGPTNGRIMTDYKKRITCFPWQTGSVVYLAENEKTPLMPNNPNAADMFAPGGFPATTVYDTILSVVPDPAGSGQGDPRLSTNLTFRAIKDVIGSSAQLKKVLTGPFGNPTRQYHSLGSANNAFAGTGYIGFQSYSVLGSGVTGANNMALAGQTTNFTLGNLGQAGGLETATTPLDGGVVGVMSGRPQDSIAANSSVGDWSSAAGYLKDGGLLPRPDQDFQSFFPGSAGSLQYVTPYFVSNTSTSDGINTPGAKGYFSPNRQIPSPISLMGSLPSSKSKGWQTLAFSPNPEAGSGHPGLANPPDYLLLDLFWMPVAEPYPISEEFSTAGKINLNYQIMPFSYIKRKTGLHALLKATWMTALDNSLARNYKSHYWVRGMSNTQTRYEIDAAETLKLFDDEVFGKGDIFRAASQFCSMWLVPKGSTASAVANFWNGKLLTSDTAREQPYDHIYSRITTKSNTYTVHWRVQALKKVPITDAGQWDEDKDRMTAELRGSTLIERYIDPNATDIPDYATDADAESLAHFYRWRVVSESFFQP